MPQAQVVYKKGRKTNTIIDANIKTSKRGVINSKTSIIKINTKKFTDKAEQSIYDLYSHIAVGIATATGGVVTLAINRSHVANAIHILKAHIPALSAQHVAVGVEHVALDAGNAVYIYNNRDILSRIKKIPRQAKQVGSRIKDLGEHLYNKAKDKMNPGEEYEPFEHMPSDAELLGMAEEGVEDGAFLMM